MKLGAFSLSLSVKDLSKSKEFYENIGLSVFGRDMKNNYLIMKNESTLMGLFQGMFEENILTFNPGWDENAKKSRRFSRCENYPARPQLYRDRNNQPSG